MGGKTVGSKEEDGAARGAGAGRAASGSKPKAKAVRRDTAGAARAKAAEPAPVQQPSDPLPLRLKELVDQVSKGTGIARRDARPVVDAVLAALGQALHGGRPLALPPFGRAKVTRRKGSDAIETLTVKLRRGGSRKRDEGLAGVEE